MLSHLYLENYSVRTTKRNTRNYIIKSQIKPVISELPFSASVYELYRSEHDLENNHLAPVAGYILDKQDVRANFSPDIRDKMYDHI